MEYKTFQIEEGKILILNKIIDYQEWMDLLDKNPSSISELDATKFEKIVNDFGLGFWRYLYKFKKLKKFIFPRNLNPEEIDLRQSPKAESLILPEGIRNIPERTFAFNHTLKEIVLPESVKVIEDQAFGGCESLVNINFPSSLEGIGNGAFENCKSLVNVNLPSSIKVIGNQAFGGCESLVNINFPSSLEGIGNGAFENCKSLVNINLPSSIKLIGNKAFYGCSELSKIELPEGLIKFGSNVFTFTRIKDLVFPSTLESFGYIASINNIDLSKCHKIKVIKSLPDNQFGRIAGFENLYLPPMLEEIEDKAIFRNVKYVTAPRTLKRIGWNSLMGFKCLSSSLDFIDSRFFSTMFNVTAKRLDYYKKLIERNDLAKNNVEVCEKDDLIDYFYDI